MIRNLTKEEVHYLLPDKVICLRVEDIGFFPWLKSYIIDKGEVSRLLQEAIAIEKSGNKACAAGYCVAVHHNTGIYYLETINESA